jgi:hypothetical protein
MTIRFPRKEDKRKGQLLNALRIMAWETYKADHKDYKPENPDDKFELYGKFKSEWELEDIHTKTTEQILEFITDLGYSEAELMRIKNDYYNKQKSFLLSQSENNSVYNSANNNYDDNFGVPF